MRLPRRSSSSQRRLPPHRIPTLCRLRRSRRPIPRRRRPRTPAPARPAPAKPAPKPTAPAPARLRASSRLPIVTPAPQTPDLAPRRRCARRHAARQAAGGNRSRRSRSGTCRFATRHCLPTGETALVLAAARDQAPAAKTTASVRSLSQRSSGSASPSCCCWPRVPRAVRRSFHQPLGTFLYERRNQFALRRREHGRRRRRLLPRRRDSVKPLMRLRRRVLIVAAAVAALSASAVASADNVQSRRRLAGRRHGWTPGSSVAIGWRIHETGDDGCGARDRCTGRRLRHARRARLRASESTLTFTSCGSPQSVTFTVAGRRSARRLSRHRLGERRRRVDRRRRVSGHPRAGAAPSARHDAARRDSSGADQTLEATSPAGATQAFSGTAVDDVDGPLSAPCPPTAYRHRLDPR